MYPCIFYMFLRTPVPLSSRILRAALYAATVCLSFFLMLVFMTYNVSRVVAVSGLDKLKCHGSMQAYLVVAVVVGAGLGHFIFNPEMDVEGVLYGATGGKGMACH